MKNERKLLEKLAEIYKNVQLTDEQKIIYEAGVAQGITFALTELIDLNIDISILQHDED